MRRRRVSARAVRVRWATTSLSTARKTFNGVALLSKFPFDEVTTGLPGDHTDDHARFIEAVISTANGAMRVATIYLPNGNPPDTDKYSYKIGWMKRLLAYARERLRCRSR